MGARTDPNFSTHRRKLEDRAGIPQVPVRSPVQLVLSILIRSCQIDVSSIVRRKVSWRIWARGCQVAPKVSSESE